MVAARPTMLALLLAVCCTSCTALPMLRDTPTSCERLQPGVLSVYDQVKYVFGQQIPGGVESVIPVSREQVEEMSCRIADASTLDELTTAIDPDLDNAIRDAIQLYYLFGTSALEFLGGVESLRTKVMFAKDWIEFAQNNKLGEQPVSYNVAYEFTTSLVGYYGADYIKTFTKGVAGILAGGWGLHASNMFNEDDILEPEKLAQALSGPLDAQTFSETSGLDTSTAQRIIDIGNFASSYPAIMMYPMISRLAESILVTMETADDLGLLDLTVQ